MTTKTFTLRPEQLDQLQWLCEHGFNTTVNEQVAINLLIAEGYRNRQDYKPLELFGLEK